jgi:hypothetical protein
MEQTEGPHNMNHLPILAVLISAALLAPGRSPAAEEKPADAASHPLHYIDSTIENGSPLWWEIEPDGAVRVHLVYDQERASPNRANGHWLFRIDAAPDADLTLVLGPFGDIWNGKPAGPVPEAKIAFVSDDGQCWRPIPVEPAEPYHLKLRVHTAGPSLYVARAAPYRLSDLEKFKAEIGRNPLVEVAVIGRTVEGRELEMIRVGRPDAPRRLLLRARAHGWEPGGNWVVEGLVRRLLRDDETARRCLDRYCVYVMPMANKDGVARGRTRFNLRGMDLNRKWDRPADPSLAPENAALEKWLEAMIARGRRPDLAIDFHNDASGKLHVSRPDLDPPQAERYLVRMQQLEKLLREHTWFTEGSTGGGFRNPGSLGEGLLARYGVPACIHELNANWIAGLDDRPSSDHWKRYGEQLAEVFRRYFETD